MNNKSLHHDDTASEVKFPSRKSRFLFVLAVVVILLGAWMVGRFRVEADMQPVLKSIFPEAGVFETVDTGSYAVWADEAKTELLGYIALQEAQGYGGTMILAVAVSGSGRIISVVVVDHKETESFLQRVRKSGLMESFTGKAYSDLFIPGQDLDSVSGATYTCRALAEGARRGSRHVAEERLGFDVPTEPAPPVVFGIAEITLVVLFILGIMAYRMPSKTRPIVRWISMLGGLIVLGFLLNKPLTLAMVNRMLLGYFPRWQTHLYWYGLLAGIVLITLIKGSNPYCQWFCPFGAAQECIGLIGGRKIALSKPVRRWLTRLQRGLALAAVAIALYYRNPSVPNYEVFGAFFRLIGSNVQFILLGIVLIASLFLHRPWCRALCPLRPVTDSIRWFRGLLQK